MVILRNSNFTYLSVILHTLYENANKQLTYTPKKKLSGIQCLNII